jgi:hypothetical protein
MDDDTPRYDETTGEIRPEPHRVFPTEPFPPEIADILMAPVDENLVLIRPDGLIYVGEIEYRRRLNAAIGPGGWQIVPLGIMVRGSVLCYEGALVALGTYRAQAIGEQSYDAENDRMSYATAAESAKSNCLVRMCKDLGMFSELWDKEWSARWVRTHAVEVWCVNVGTRDRGKKKKQWKKKGDPPIDVYPWKEESIADAGGETPYAGRPRQDERVRHAAPTESQGVAGAVREATFPTQLSEPQARKFHAVAKAKGWTDGAKEAIYRKYKITAIEQLERRDFDAVLAMLDDADARDKANAWAAIRGGR